MQFRENALLCKQTDKVAMEIHILSEDKVGLREVAQLVWTHVGDLTQGDSFFRKRSIPGFLSSGTTSAVFFPSKNRAIYDVREEWR